MTNVYPGVLSIGVRDPQFRHHSIIQHLLPHGVPRINRFIQMLLVVLQTPFDIDWYVTLDITLYVNLFTLDDEYLFIFGSEMGGY